MRLQGFLSAMLLGAGGIVLALVPSGDVGQRTWQPDQTLHYDADGHAWYRCLRGRTAVRSTITTRSGAAVPITAPPVRHSLPGSGKIIYLDFNGGIVSGTAWNTTVSSYDCLPYDIDGDPTTFSAQEQADIVRIWKRVAEDYAPFAVDVTTEEPATFTSTTAWALITPDVDRNGKDLPHKDAGGIAYIDIFGSGSLRTYSPAWVAADMEPGDVADAAAHEVGHNLGLGHDGLSGAVKPEYHFGNPASAAAPSWGPIMGAPYDKTLSQWCQGEYANATNHQDDLAIIAAKLGYIADDHGDTPSTATAIVPGLAGSVTAAGVIGRTGDVDCFSVTVAAGTVAIQVVGNRDADGTGGNLDLAIALRDAGGSVVASANPAATADAALSQVVAAGTYTIEVSPSGAGSPLATPSTGYTVYGSLGRYTVSGTVPLPARLTVTGVGAAIGILAGDATPTIAEGSDFATVTAGDSLQRTFVLSDEGAGTVTITGPVTVTGNAAFTVTGQPVLMTLSGGATTTCAVTFAPTTGTTLTGVVSIPTDAGTFTFAVQGTVGYPPVVTAGSVAGTVGSAFSTTVSASGVTAFSASGLPGGLTIAANTGVISGTPTTAGIFAVTVTGTNAAGSDSAIITIAIAQPVASGPAAASDSGGGGGGACGAGSGLALVLMLLAQRLSARRR